jgi:DeoR family transcriptional regulator of aga operon
MTSRPRAEVRREDIVQFVRGKGFASVSELAHRFRVSEMTIRRDLQELASRHLVRQAHGGANALVDAGEGIDFRLRSSQAVAAKSAIATRALDYISLRATIAIDSGTTTLELARQLPANQGILVVTHSLPALTVLSRLEGVEVVSLGGALQRRTQSFAGQMTLSAIESFRVDTFFMAGSSVRDGMIYVGNSFDAQAKQAFIEVSDRVILLVDSSKFRSAALLPVAPIEHVDLVISDANIPPETVNELNARGVELVVVDLPVASETRATVKPPRTAVMGGANGARADRHRAR